MLTVCVHICRKCVAQVAGFWPGAVQVGVGQAVYAGAELARLAVETVEKPECVGIADQQVETAVLFALGGQLLHKGLGCLSALQVV